MALDSLYVAYTRNTKLENSDRVRASIQALFKQFEDPSSYNAFKFAQSIRSISEVLR